MNPKRRPRVLDAEWTPIKRNATRNQRKRKRAIQRDVVLLALVIILMVGGTCAINCLVPPVDGEAAGYAAAELI